LLDDLFDFDFDFYLFLDRLYLLDDLFDFDLFDYFLDDFNRILDSLNDLDSPVVVEGHSDTLALRSLGYHGEVIELNDGQSVLSTVEKL